MVKMPMSYMSKLFNLLETKMEIKLRALSTFNNQSVEQNISSDLVLGSTSGIQCRCDPATLELVIDGQAVKVAKIKELMVLKAAICHLIELANGDRNGADVVSDLIKLIIN